MLSKNQIKLITSLHQKKYRNKYNFFVAEGVKVVNEFLISSIKLEHLFCTDDFLYQISEEKVQHISEKELEKISLLKSPNKVVGIFNIPIQTEIIYKGFTLVLDDINDPGNLGTIIRLCDWFGIENIVCSKSTVDCYNAKVVQATMGSLSRVNINYLDIVEFLKNSDSPIYGAAMNGKNIYKTSMEKNAILVMGNEANGISNAVSNLIGENLTIPRFGKNQQTESLNVATATAILLSEFKRNS